MFESNDDSVELSLFIKSSDCGRVRFKFDLPLIKVSLRYFTDDYDDDFFSWFFIRRVWFLFLPMIS